MSYDATLQNFKVTVAATPALIEFEVGAVPSRIEVENLSTGAFGSWSAQMNDGALFVKSDGGGGGGVGLKTADGITVINNTEDKVQGFSLGTLADFNDNAGEELSVSVWASDNANA